MRKRSLKMNEEQHKLLNIKLQQQNEALSIKLKTAEEKNMQFGRRIKRERNARKEAERILEEKSLELYQANLQLAHLNAELKNTIQEQIKALEQSITSLEKANNDIRQFTYLASHDLKTPLRAIGSLIGFVEQDVQSYPEISQDTLECILLIRTRVNRMHRLLNSILEYSNIGKNKYKTEDITIKEVVSDVVNSLSFDYHPTIIFKDDLFNLSVSRKRIYQILKHIIENAIKYHHNIDDVKLEVYSQKTDKWIKLFIKDNGPGIAKKYHNRIFQIFQTLETKDKNKEGIGIGLPIVKKIVEEEIKGELILDSDQGKGTTFIFCFPIESLIV